MGGIVSDFDHSNRGATMKQDLQRRQRHTNSSKLSTDVQNHDNGHAERNNVHGACRTLEDDCVCQLNAACVAVGLNPDYIVDFADV